MARVRNTKARAQRIEREYFKNAFFISRWRMGLTLVLILAGIGWLAWRAMAHDQTPFSSGPVNPLHASFERDCASCHALRTPAGSTVSNQACERCHDGPIHHEQQASTPDCVACHVDHTGAQKLLAAGDKTCTHCHANLKIKTGRLTLVSHIYSFSSGHPEFTPLRPGHDDPGTIKFNHKVHLKKNLAGPRGPIQLECGDCHRPPGIQQAWPYGRLETAAVAEVVGRLTPRPLVSVRAYMQPVNYYEHCSSCHPLVVDRRISEPVPHKRPEFVISFLEQRLSAYISAHPEEIRSSAESMPIPRITSGPAPRTAAEWVGQRMEDSKRLLWSKTCLECHSLTGVASQPLPKIQDVRLTTRWLQHGIFDHSAHKMVDCTSCHTQTKSSERTSDVLIPGIKSCQGCHSREKIIGSGSAECFECHQYHDWTKEKSRHGIVRPRARPAVTDFSADRASN